MKVVRRDRFELSLSGYKPPVLTTELSEHIALITFLICFIQYFRLSECQASFRFANHIFCIAQMVRVTRLELARDNAHRNLNPMCLPIPPHPHFAVCPAVNRLSDLSLHIKKGGESIYQ